MSKPRVLAEPILVGRDKELEQLHHFLNLASEGKGKTVFISAEAGVGKTRLLQEFLNSEKQSKNTVILSGWSLFNAGLPYFPFIEAFSTYYSALGEKGEKEESELNSWLKGPAKAELFGKFQYLSPQALKDQTFAAVAKTIHSIASQNQVILAIEDIHWADSASLALLHYIARAVKGSERVLVLATFRSEELTHDSDGYPHQLVETLAMMRREDLFDQINLPNLDPVYITKMVESMLDGAVQQDLAEKLIVKSEGNPLFVVESLRMLNEQRKLVQKNNEWHLAVEEIEIPSKIKDIMIQRLACLNSTQTRILNAASVIGDEFEVGLLSAVVNEDSLDVLETLNAIAQLTSIVCVDEDRFRFDHARSREIVYGTIAMPLRQGYHKRVAENLEGSRSAVLQLSDLAYHYAQAGNEGKAVKYALASGQSELARWSNAQAIEHFTYVLQVVGHGAEPSENRVIALEGLGDALYGSSLFKNSMKIFEELADATESSVVRLRAFRKALESAFQRGDVPCLLELAKKAGHLATADHLETARVLLAKGRAISLHSQISESLEDCSNALRVFEEEYSLWDVAVALMSVGIDHALLGEVRKGIAECLRSIALFEELSDFRMTMEACWLAGAAFSICGLTEEALEMFQKVIEVDSKNKIGDFVRLVQAYRISANIFEGIDDISRAIEYNLKAFELAGKTDSLVAQGVVDANLVRLYARDGDIERAEEYLNKLRILPPEVLKFPGLDELRTMAIYCAAKNQWNESNRYFKDCFERVFDQKYYSSEDFAVKSSYAWALEKRGHDAEARVLRQDIRSMKRRVEGLFDHGNLEAYVMVPTQIATGDEVEMRFDFVNVSRKPCKLVKIAEAIPSQFNMAGPPAFCNLQDRSLHIKEKRVEPFQVETLKLKFIVKETGSYCLEPKLFYEDDLGNKKIFSVKSIIIMAKSAKPGSLESTIERFSEFSKQKPTLRSEAAQKTIDYLFSAFEEDFVKRELTEEKSGWRSLMNIVKNGKVSKHSIYGRSGRGGKVICELKSNGLLEMRVFQGEAGRGGHIVKIRICQNNKNFQPVLRK